MSPFMDPFWSAPAWTIRAAAEILAAVPRTPGDSAEAMRRLFASHPGEIYLKNMAHHMVDMPWDWASEAAHIFWIRHPRKVIRSFAKVWPQVNLEDIGIHEQVAQWAQIQGFHGPQNPGGQR